MLSLRKTKIKTKMHWYTNDNKWRKIMRTKLFYRITMLRFGKTKVAINEFYGAKKSNKTLGC